MSFDPENILLVPSDWFSTDISYEGRGRAEFHDPPGTVEGAARIRIDESGTLSVELNIERVMSAQPLLMGLIQLFSGQKPVEVNGSIGIGGEPPNTCTKLTVTTPQGEFSASLQLQRRYF